jgi:uncharacterized protein
MNLQETTSVAQLFNMGKNYLAIRNYEKAQEYLTAAVLKGSSKAARELMHLAQCFYEERNPAAEVCFQTLAGRGSAEACLYLGRMCLRAVGREKNYDEAFSWFDQGYTLGSAEAAYEAGMMILPDIFRDETAKACATDWFHAAAEGGFVPAYTQLGLICCAQGDEQLKEALDYFLAGTEGGDTDSMVYAAQMYLDGAGTSKNVTLGLSLLQRAADAGNAKACRAFGDLYERGAHVDKDKEKAAGYYKLAEKYDDEKYDDE